MPADSVDPGRPQVILVSGPSGSGKSRLARHLEGAHHWPTIELDDFYREGTDPHLPMSPLGLPDWDDAGCWDHDAALTALQTLCDLGSANVPTYDISTSSITGSRTVGSNGSSIVVAEGIFAAHLIPVLRAEGRLAGAWCIRDHPWLTFAKRFTRDVKQRRKPVGTLWRRGHALRRAEPGIVSEHISRGATALSGRAARAHALTILSPHGSEADSPHE